MERIIENIQKICREIVKLPSELETENIITEAQRKPVSTLPAVSSALYYLQCFIYFIVYSFAVLSDFLLFNAFQQKNKWISTEEYSYQVNCLVFDLSLRILSIL